MISRFRNIARWFWLVLAVAGAIVGLAGVILGMPSVAVCLLAAFLFWTYAVDE